MRKSSDVKHPWKIAKVLVVAALVAGVFGIGARPLVATAVAPTTVPNTISFQGKIVNFSNGTNVADGTYSVTFRLYSALSGGTAVWGETQASVTVAGGVFQVNLGSTCSFFVTQTCSGISNTAIDFSTGPSLYLTVQFAADSQETSPRIPLQSVPFAFNAETANKLGGLGASQFIQLAQGTAQTDSSTTAPSIFINKTNGTGTPNILQVQKANSDVMVLDNSGNLVLGAASGSNILTMTRNQNNATLASLTNTSATTAAAAGFAAYNTATNGFGFFGIGGTAYTTIPILQNRAAISTGSSTAGIVLNAAGATQNILFAINGTEVARFDNTGTFLQAGANAFTTGSGAVSLNGDTTIASGKNLTLTAGNATLTSGNLAVSGTYNTNTFNSSTLTFAGASANSINGTSGQTLTVQSQGGAGQLILGSSNGTLGLSAATTTIQHTASGTTILDLKDAANTVLQVFNSGTGVSNLQLYGGGLCTGSAACTTGGATMRLDNAGNLTNIGTVAATGAVTISGTGANELAVTGAPAASATSSLVQFGAAIASGNAVASGGTYFSINVPTSGAGSAADYLNFQDNGTSVLKVMATGSVALANASLGQASLTLANSAGSNVFTLENLGPSFGAAASAGAFVSKNSYFGEEFNSFHQNNGAADWAMGRGDSGNPNTAAGTAGGGELTYDVTLTGTGSATSSTLASTAGGVEQLTATSALVGTSVADEYLAGANAVGTAQKNWTVGNLPLYTAKVRMATAGSNTIRYFVGLSDMQATATGAPTNGIYFTNCSVAAGTTCDTTLRGVTQNAAGAATFVTCGTIVPGNFMYLRIEARTATDIHFYADLNVSDGITETECGTGSTLTIPASGTTLTYMTKVDNTTAAAATATLMVDFVRIWQDDPASPGLVAESSTGGTSDSEATSSSSPTPAASGTDPNATGLQPDTGSTLDNVSFDTVSTSGIANLGSENAKAVNIAKSDTVTTIAGGLEAEGTANFAKDVTANGALVAKGGSFQLLGTDGNQLISFNSDGAAFTGNLSAASASLSGGLSVDGDATFHGLSTFEKVATFFAKTIFRQDVQFDGHLAVGQDTAGYATLHAGETIVHVTFATEYDVKPLVSATISNGKFAQYSINNTDTKGFDIMLKDASDSDITLSWLAVGATNPQTATNPPANP